MKLMHYELQDKYKKSLGRTCVSLGVCVAAFSAAATIIAAVIDSSQAAVTLSVVPVSTLVITGMGALVFAGLNATYAGGVAVFAKIAKQREDQFFRSIENKKPRLMIPPYEI